MNKTNKCNILLKKAIKESLIQLGILTLFGALLGYLLYRNAKEQGVAYLIFSICVFILIGIILMIRNIIKTKKRINQQNPEVKNGDNL